MADTSSDLKAPNAACKLASKTIASSDVAAFAGLHAYVPRSLAIYRWLARAGVLPPTEEQRWDNWLRAQGAAAAAALDATRGDLALVRQSLRKLAADAKLPDDDANALLAQAERLSHFATGRASETDEVARERIAESNTRWVRFAVRPDVVILGRLDGRRDEPDGRRVWIELKRRVGALPPAPPAYDIIQVRAYLAAGAHVLGDRMVLREVDSAGRARETEVRADPAAWAEIETALVASARLARRMAEDPVPHRRRAFAEHVRAGRHVAAERVLASYVPRMDDGRAWPIETDLAVEKAMHVETN
jgi:hypothetical protein